MIDHIDGYDPVVTTLCDRALVTILGNAGFWGRSMYLVGGLAVRYLVGETAVATPHVGSRDVDLAIVMAVDGEGADYETLARNLRETGFEQAPNDGEPAFRWRISEDEQDAVVEFLGESDSVSPGRMFKPRAGSGSQFQVLNVPGVRLLPRDHRVVPLTAERLGGGGSSTVDVQVAGLLPYVVLKTRAYCDRHHAKDAYDLVYALRHQADGAGGAGRLLAQSPVVADELSVNAIVMLEEHFAGPDQDGPTDYARFLDVLGDREVTARLKNEAVAVVGAAIEGYR